MQRRRNEAQQRSLIRKLYAGKIPVRLQCAVAMQHPHPSPVVERLERQVEIVIGLNLQHNQPSAPIHRQQIQHPTTSLRKRRHLRIDRPVSQ